MASPATQPLSSDLGDSPFDKAVCNRDKILAGFVKKINRLSVEVATDQNVILSDAWGDEIISVCAAAFPGMGGFGPGGGPLS
jgi:hypothetical protein